MIAFIIFWIACCIYGGDYTIASFEHISYTFKHCKAMRKLQIETLGDWMFPWHDIDKIFMYIFIPFIGTEAIKKIHKKYNKHHLKDNTSTGETMVFIEALLDWESAQYTKKDKPGNAYWTIHKKFRPQAQMDTLMVCLKSLNSMNPNIKLESNI